MRGNKYLFEVFNKCCLGSTDSGRNPNNIPIRRQRKGVFIRKGRRTITSIEERHFKKYNLHPTLKHFFIGFRERGRWREV